MNASSDATCRALIEAVLAGDFSMFSGLAGCARLDAEQVLGPSAPSHGWLGECRRSSAPGAKPASVEAVYRGEQLFALLFRPVWPAAALDALGPPDDERVSGIGIEYRQKTWAARGVIAHTALLDRSVELLAVFPPAPLSTLETSRIFRLAVRERMNF
jgi:hypothetical protein